MNNTSRTHLFNKMTRREAATEYMTSAELFQELAYVVNEDIIERKHDWTSFRTPALPPDYRWKVGGMEYDEELLKVVEGKLKSAFNQVNHLRFGGCGDIVIDTKPNTRWRLWRATPGCSDGRFRHL